MTLSPGRPLASLARIGQLRSLTLALLAGCVGQGSGQVSGDLYINACDQRNRLDKHPYNMNPDFFVGEPIEDINQNGYPQNRLEIRIQATASNLGGVVTSLDQGAGVDTLFISISDVYAVAQMVNTDIALNPIDVNYLGPTPPPVRIALGMLGTCPFSPNNTVYADVGSTIHFTKFGCVTDNPPCTLAPDYKVDFGEDLEATFELNLVDLRATLFKSMPQAGAHVSGNFSFELRRGAAGQTFP
jgi:hypothetical protein